MSVATPIRLAWYHRTVLLLTSFGLISIFGLATLLEPDERGYGTHENIWGLSPCWFVENWNIPCPSCGMTTSWAHLVRGEVWDSLRANSGGTVLAVATLWFSWSLLASAIRGLWIGQPPGRWTLAIVALSVGGIICVDWIIRLLILLL